MNIKNLRGNILLTLAALIWGAAFVAQDIGMDHIGPFTFTAARMLIGSIVLLVFIFLRKVLGKTEAKTKTQRENKSLKTHILGGLICGIVLFMASSLQQVGIAEYSDLEAAAGKAGFITALYIVFVPVIAIFFKKKAGVSVWMSVALALFGMYLLCVKGGVGLSRPDILLILSALCLSVHILVIGYFSRRTDCFLLSGIQLFVASIISAIVMIFTETPTIPSLQAAWLPVLYAGVLSCGIAYTLQVVAQKNTDPSVASLIMSMESVFAALAGWLILGERFSARELLGCAVVFAAVLLAQIDLKVLFTRKSVLARTHNK